MLCVFEVLQQLLCNICIVCSKEAQFPLNGIVAVASFPVKPTILKHTVFICFSGLLCECVFQWKTTWFCCDSSFHFCPTRLQRCPTTLLGYSFLPLFVMQIFQQQCSFLVTAPVSCRKPTIIFLLVLSFFFFLLLSVSFSVSFSFLSSSSPFQAS